jgi:tRNA A37 threonylcarbamoyladenosine synthetase subunit TsaC/SUA5/YrdC
MAVHYASSQNHKKKQQFLTKKILQLFWPTPSTFVMFPHIPQWRKWLI